MNIEQLKNKIFTLTFDSDFNAVALEIFHFQYAQNQVYHQYVDLLRTKIDEISHYSKIPFLPVEFFKSQKIICRDAAPEKVFLSSGTTGSLVSKHYVPDLSIYEKSFLKGFELFYGNPEQFIILAILPSYLERKDSSLVYMAGKLIELSKNPSSGFFLQNYDALIEILSRSTGQKVFLLGVTYALLDLAENYKFPPFNGIIMETGGMKGRRKEIIREELHAFLCEGFQVQQIHSEYGMTELLSQAYSKGNGIFKSPPWMKVLIRDTNDPKSLAGDHKTGGINIIDLANIHSCSFIATQDLGKTHTDGSFEILGRFDNSDIRGCNLMIG